MKKLTTFDVIGCILITILYGYFTKPVWYGNFIKHFWTLDDQSNGVSLAILNELFDYPDDSGDLQSLNIFQWMNVLDLDFFYCRSQQISDPEYYENVVNGIFTKWQKINSTHITHITHHKTLYNMCGEIAYSWSSNENNIVFLNNFSKFIQRHVQAETQLQITNKGSLTTILVCFFKQMIPENNLLNT